MATIGKIDKDGTQIGFVKFGNGPKPLVMLPGMTTHSILPLGDAVEAAFETTKNDFTTYLIERKDVVPAGYDMDDFADDVAYVIETLDIAPAYVYGVSFGGMIAKNLAQRYPQLVKKLALCSCVGDVNENTDKFLRKWYGAAKRRDAKALTELFVDNVYSEKSLENGIRDAIIAESVSLTEEEFVRFENQLESTLFHYPKNDGEISCETLVIAARGDRIFPFDEQKRHAEEINATFVSYDGPYGHAVYDENPDVKEKLKLFFYK